jgi:hypothetical protein
LVCGDQRLIAVDREAALFAIQQAEGCALARRRGGRDWIQTGNVVAVMFEHYDARESRHGHHGPMPQLHHHFFLVNLTRLANGGWRSLDPQQIYKARRFIDAIYMAELAKRVQALGYAIERRPDGAFELAGFTRKQIEAFSEWALDIERTKAEREITDPRAARTILLETRLPKREYGLELLRAEREALARAEGIDLSLRPTPRQRALSDTAGADDAADFSIRHLNARYAVVDHRDLIAAALIHGLGKTDLEQTQRGSGCAKRLRSTDSNRSVLPASSRHL